MTRRPETPLIDGAIVPRAASLLERGLTRAGLLLGRDPSGEPRVAPGHFDPLDWWWDAATATMSVRLQAGPRGLTLVTAGDLQERDGEVYEVNAALTDLMRVVPWRRDDPLPGASSGGTRTRPSGLILPDAERLLGTLGLDVTGRNGLILTDRGPGLLGGVFTTGGAPRTNELDPGRPVSVAGIRTAARFATWQEGGDKHHSYPLAMEWEDSAGRATRYRISSRGAPAGKDVSAYLGAFRPVHVWGVLRPYDMALGGPPLKPNADPDAQDVMDRRRWAVLVEFDAEKLLGDDEPPPPPDPKKPPKPPPFVPGGSGGPGGRLLADPDLSNPATRPPKPGTGVPGQEEEDDEDEQISVPSPNGTPAGVQVRGAFQEDQDEKDFVPGQDTFIPGTGLPDPGSTLEGEVGGGLTGQTIKGCPLGDNPLVNWVPSPTGTPISGDGAGAGAGLVGGAVGGGLVGVQPGGGAIGAAGGLTPGQRAALVLEDGSQVKTTVPDPKSLTPAQKAVLLDTVLPPGIARVPSPIGVLGDAFGMKGIVALAVRQLNGLTDMVQAALGGGRFSYYAGNLGIVNTNQQVSPNGKPLGVSEQFIGQHLVDPDPKRPIPAALHLFQALEGKRKALVADRPAHLLERISKGSVIAATALLELRKRTAKGAVDTGNWIGARAADGSTPFNVTNGGKGYFAGGTSGDHYHLQDVDTVEEIDSVEFTVQGAKLTINNDAGTEIGSAAFTKRGSNAKLTLSGGSGGTSELVADTVTTDTVDGAKALVMESQASKPAALGSSVEPGFWVKTDGIASGQHQGRFFDGTNDHAINVGTVGPTGGGTGLTSYATGDILYASAANTLAKLAAGTNGHVLTLAGGVPSWAAPASSGTTREVLKNAYQSSGTSMSYTVPGGTLASDGDQLVIEAWGKCSVFSSETIRMTFGAASWGGQTVASSINWVHRVRIVRTGATSQQIYFENFANTTSAVVDNTGATETLSGDITLTADYSTANNAGRVVNYLRVEYIPAT